MLLTCPAYCPNFFLSPTARPVRHFAAKATNMTLVSFPTTYKRGKRDTQNSHSPVERNLKHNLKTTLKVIMLMDNQLYFLQKRKDSYLTISNLGDSLQYVLSSISKFNQ